MKMWLGTFRPFILVVLMASLAVALPGTTEATNLHEIKKLLASDGEVGDEFGVGVALSGDTAVVGALSEAAYVIGRDEGGAGNWGEVNKLTASDSEVDDLFGVQVAISGDVAVVGAFLENAGGFQAGAAYIFLRDQGGADNWGEVKKLIASDAEPGDAFGWGAALNGDTIVVGAPRGDDGGSNAGEAYVFRRHEGGAGRLSGWYVGFASSRCPASSW